MDKINIKKDSTLQKETLDQQLDLKNRQVIRKQKKPSRFWLFLSLFLIFLLIGLGMKWYLEKPKESNFRNLISEKNVVYSLIDQKSLYLQTSPFHQFLKNNNLYASATNQLALYFSEAGLDYQEVMNNGFKNQVGFILLPGNQDSSFPFILALEKKNSFWDLNQELDKIEKYLKKDFNFQNKFYRQIEISILNPLREIKPGFPETYAYAQIEDYFIVSNSLDTLKNIIDNLID